MRLGWGLIGVLVTLYGGGCGPTDVEPGPEPEPGAPVSLEPPPAETLPDPEEPEAEPVPCVPVTCEALGSCGQVPDGCGGTLACAPCETRECVPDACRDMGARCGDLPDGCGGTLHCGTCGAGEACGLFAGLECVSCSPDVKLGSTLPLHVTDRPRHKRSGWDPNDDPDYTFSHSLLEWTAPHTGFYVISDMGSEKDVGMRISTQACERVPPRGPTQAFPHRYELEQGQHVYLTFSGQWSRFGGKATYQLRIFEWVPDERGRCGNRIDDDGDGVVDCGDPDCVRTLECLRGTACADVDLGSALPASGRDDTSGTPDFFETSCGIPGNGERVFAWTAPKAGRFVFQPRDGYGSVISAWSGCRGTELACSVERDLLDLTDKQAVVVRELAAGESLLLVLEGWYSLEHHPEPTPTELLVHEWLPEGAGLCTDGLDNDGDGLVDEMDPGCPNYGEGW